MSTSPFADHIQANGHFPPLGSNGVPTGPANGGPTGPANGGLNGHGPMSVPVQSARPGNGVNGPLNQLPTNGQHARSPPNQKNFAHVPCKFFKSGQCQAGNTCPFAHGTVTVPCKYFQKGNCKFGLKCANDHITADGRRINKQSHLQMHPHFANAGQQRMMPMPGAMGGPRADSFMPPQFGQMPSDELTGGPWPPRQPQDVPIISTMDAMGLSVPTSPAASPQMEGFLGANLRDRPTIQNVGLPASFDSNGISLYARTGPFATSVPARLGSSPPEAPQFRMSALRNLHAGIDENPNRNGFGTSPSVNPGEELIGRRIMHSERFSSRPKMLSSSFGEFGSEWDTESPFLFEDDQLQYLPESLNVLLTPNERARRLSRTQEDADALQSHRSALSGLGTPAGNGSPSVGSPIGVSGASPRGFGPLFPRTRERGESAGESGRVDSSAFGHVGSPLRPSPLNPGSSPSMRPVSGSGVAGLSSSFSARPASGEFPALSSPRNTTISMISQQLQRTRLSSRASDTSIDGNLANGSTGNAARGGGGSLHASSQAIAVPRRLTDRTASGTSSLGIGRDRIDEEAAGVFSMDDDDANTASNARWRMSGGPTVGVIGSPPLEGLGANIAGK